MNRKVLGLLLSLILVLGVAIPGTLAFSADAANTERAMTMDETQQAVAASDESNDGAATDSAHIDPCVEGCTGAGCACPCHTPSLFDRIMACTSLEEIDAILAEATDAEFAALTDAENWQIDAHIASLEPAPLPAVVIDESTEETVPSEIIYPTVSFTNVAPLGSPVVGGANEGGSR